MKTTREQIVDFIFSLPDEQLKVLKKGINEHTELSNHTKEIMNNVVDSAIGFNSRFEIIKKYIDEYDFYSLLEHGAPNDEFDSYSRELADKISIEDNIRSIADKIAILLDKAFNEEVNAEKYMDIAQKIKNGLMRQILVEVNDSYEGFVKAVLNYVDKKEERYNIVLDYVKGNPEALSADILEFISDQDDFYDEMWKQYVKVGNLKELHEKLRNVPGSYPAFVGGIIRYASTDRSRKEKVLAYMDENPNAKPSDITKFVMEQSDFHEAAKSTLRK